MSLRGSLHLNAGALQEFERLAGLHRIEPQFSANENEPRASLLRHFRHRRDLYLVTPKPTPAPKRRALFRTNIRKTVLWYQKL